MTGPATLGELVALLGGCLDGARAGTRVLGLTGLDADDTRNRLAVLTDPRYEKYLATFQGAAVVVSESASVVEGVPLWRHPDPVSLRSSLHHRFAPFDMSGPWSGVSLEAFVAPDADLGEYVTVGPAAAISAGSKIGAGCRVGAGAVVCGSEIGPGCIIGANAYTGPAVRLGRGVEVGPNAVIGSQGFGYEETDSGLERIPHIGGVVVEDDVHIGAGSCIDSGTLHPTRVGSGSRIDNLVHIAHNAQVGRHCVILAQAGIAGSAVLEDGVAVAGQAGVAGHIRLGAGSRVAAQAGVGQNLEPGSTVGGTPAFAIGKWRRVGVLLQSLGERFKLIDELRARVQRLERRLGKKDAADGDETSE